jgi:hypothetical protein
MLPFILPVKRALVFNLLKPKHRPLVHCPAPSPYLSFKTPLSWAVVGNYTHVIEGLS